MATRNKIRTECFGARPAPGGRINQPLRRRGPPQRSDIRHFFMGTIKNAFFKKIMFYKRRQPGAARLLSGGFEPVWGGVPLPLTQSLNQQVWVAARGRRSPRQRPRVTSRRSGGRESVRRESNLRAGRIVASRQGSKVREGPENAARVGSFPPRCSPRRRPASMRRVSFSRYECRIPSAASRKT